MENFSEDNSVYENVNDYGKGKWVDLTSVHNSLSGNAGQSGFRLMKIRFLILQVFQMLLSAIQLWLTGFISFVL